MKHIISLTVFIFLAMNISCSSLTVKTDFDSQYDFSKFKTYRWASGKEINPQDELVKSPLILKRVRNAVDKVLAVKGFKQVEGNDFDVVMVVHAGSKEKMSVHSTGGGYYGGYGGWYDPWWGPYGGNTTVSYYEEATLVIDMVVWETKELGWRGLATDTVQDNLDAEEQQERLNGIVAKVFAEYPPGSKK